MTRYALGCDPSDPNCCILLILSFALIIMFLVIIEQNTTQYVRKSNSSDRLIFVRRRNYCVRPLILCVSACNSACTFRSKVGSVRRQRFAMDEGCRDGVRFKRHRGRAILGARYEVRHVSCGICEERNDLRKLLPF